MFIDSNGLPRLPKAYLAGTEIFYKNSSEVQDLYHKLCDKYGIIGLYPSDEAPNDEYKEYTPANKTVPEMEKTFFTHDVNHIRRSDIIIANLNSYRGNQADSGTAAECGIAYGWGKRCFAFLQDTETMLNTYKGIINIDEKGIAHDANGLIIEDFDLPLPFMLSVPFTVFKGGLEDALKGIRDILNAELITAGHPPFKVI